MMEDPGSLHTESSRPVEEEGAPTWMVTFGDMMSLLLTFFILLYSMSELRQERFVLASQSLREAMGSTAPEPPSDPQSLLEDPDAEEPGPLESTPATATAPAPANAPREGDADSGGPVDDVLEMFTEAYMRMLTERLERLAAEQGLDRRTVEVVTLDDGVYLRIMDAVLFFSGDAALTDAGESIVNGLSELTTSLEIPTVVSGHADDRPISTDRYPSNWELSAARAAGVARLLVARGQDPTALLVYSYGEHAPIADNGTAEGRARNRRVELFFSREEIRRAAARLMGTTGGLGIDPEGAGS